MKILFLDVDGVLNSRRYFVANKIDGICRSMDPQAVALLNRLHERVPKLKIVISSTWRKVYSMAKIRRSLQVAGYRTPTRVIGKTKDLSSIRGVEVAEWLHRHALDDIDGIAIVDDDRDMGELEPWLVKTKFDDGLVSSDVDRLAETLHAPPPTIERLDAFVQDRLARGRVVG